MYKFCSRDWRTGETVGVHPWLDTTSKRSWEDPVLEPEKMPKWGIEIGSGFVYHSCIVRLHFSQQEHAAAYRDDELVQDKLKRRLLPGRFLQTVSAGPCAYEDEPRPKLCLKVVRVFRIEVCLGSTR